MSVMELAKHWNEKVSERKIGIDELIQAHASGSLKEVFGAGTAAVISPVGQIKYGDQVITINDNQTGLDGSLKRFVLWSWLETLLPPPGQNEG